MILVDCHCHLDHPDFKGEVDKVVENAKNAGVKAIISAGINGYTNRIVLDLARKHDLIKPALGMYPPDALEMEIDEDGLEWVGHEKTPDIDKEIEFIKQNKDQIIAIGEIGLDFANFKDQEMQKDLYKKMIELGIELDKPIIIHSRKAENDSVEILEKYNYKKTILHCFCGKKKLMLRAAKNGWFFTVPTCVVKSEQFQIMAKEVNINQLLTETDSPFLTPFTGQRNEPANVLESVKKIAEIKGMTVDDTAKNIFMNYEKLFL